jgi:hypothetical protein
VMFKGQIVAIVPAEKINKEYLGLLMAGVHPDEAVEKSIQPTEQVERVF